TGGKGGDSGGGAVYNLALIAPRGNNTGFVGDGTSPSASLTLVNDILAGSTSGGSAQSDPVNHQKDGTASGNARRGGHDLGPSAPDVQQNGPVTPAAGSFLGGDPLLAALANYGGPTPTLALLPGSPAIDAGTASAAPRLDARGQGRSGRDNNGTPL